MNRMFPAFLAGIMALFFLFPTIHELLEPYWKLMVTNEVIVGWWVLTVFIVEVSMPLLTCVLLLWLVQALRKKATATMEYEDLVGCLDSCCVHDCIPPPPPPPPPRTPSPPRPYKASPQNPPNKENKKRNRVANVRKGFSKSRKNREYTRPGPKPNPHSNTNFILGERHIRLSLDIQDKLSLAQCTWPTSKHGGLRKSYSRTTCCTGIMCLRDFRDQAGGSEALAGLVSTYRRYYHSLDFDKQRMWWSEHTDYTGYDVIADGGVLRRGNKYHTHWFENINMMRTRLAAVKNSDVLRPVPITAYQPVCQKFLLFLIAGNHNTKDQHQLRKNAFTGLEAVTPEVLDCNIGNLRSPRSPTCDPEGI
jgi:hypothetical protein